MNIKIQKENIVNSVILLPIIFSFTGLFLYENAAKNILVIIAISCVTSLIYYHTNHIKEQIKNNKLIWILVITVIFEIFQNYLHGFSSGLIKTHIAILIYFIITPLHLFKGIKKHLTTLVFLATITSIAYYFYQTHILENNREHWDFGVLHYTVLSVWLACYCFYKSLQPSDKKHLALYVFIIFSNISIINAVQARTSLLALCTVFVITLIYRFKSSPKWIAISTLSTFAILSIILSYSSSFENRISETKKEINNISNGNYHTSIGHRLQMWRAASIIIPQHPILGSGENHRSIKKALAEENIIPVSIVKYRHYHNNYVNSLVKNGAVGLILTLSILIYPLVYFLKSNTFENIPIVFISLIYGIISLMNVPFTNLQLNIFYLIIVWIYIASISKEIENKAIGKQDDTSCFR